MIRSSTGGALVRDFFRLKVVSKRQVTIPQLMLEKLHMQEGDELEVEIEDSTIVALRPLKLVPTNFFSDGMLQKLEERSRSMDAGRKAHQPELTADDPRIRSRIPDKMHIGKEVSRDEKIGSASGS
jgi:AbrB family looped-hinge helix DNA binding protein